MTLIETPPEGDLTQIAHDALWSAWSTRSKRAAHLLRWLEYSEGRAGIPDVDDDASEELKSIARNAVINMCGVVVDTFDAGLSVVGFRSPDELDDDEAAWSLWQHSDMDARQSEVHRAALIYGESFVSVLPDDGAGGRPTMATWSPRDVVAEYDDPRRDRFPSSAMLLRPVEGGWSVLMIDRWTVTPGIISERRKHEGADAVGGRLIEDVEVTGDPWEHHATYDGSPVCPVVRFVNERSVENRPPRGEVEPLVTLQRSINVANFHRLVVATHGAFRQKAVIGWSAPAGELIKAAASKVWAFDDHPDDVRLQDFAPSPLAPYDGLVTGLKEQVALQAAIPIYTATGNISNVSTDTAAMVENAHQRKLGRKRESFGESWEQALRLAVTMDGGEQPADDAEVVWRETQARAFGAVVDGIVKLASIPPENGGVLAELLDLVPGMTQQKRRAIADVVRRERSSLTVAGLTAAAQARVAEAAGDADGG